MWRRRGGCVGGFTKTFKTNVVVTSIVLTRSTESKRGGFRDEGSRTKVGFLRHICSCLKGTETQDDPNRLSLGIVLYRPPSSYFRLTNKGTGRETFQWSPVDKESVFSDTEFLVRSVGWGGLKKIKRIGQEVGRENPGPHHHKDNDRDPMTKESSHDRPNDPVTDPLMITSDVSNYVTLTQGKLYVHHRRTSLVKWKRGMWRGRINNGSGPRVTSGALKDNGGRT